MENIKNIALMLQREYKKLHSLIIDCDDDDSISLTCRRYKGENSGTVRQARYLEGISNVRVLSSYTSKLCKTNKWALSACISIALAYPEITFTVDV